MVKLVVLVLAISIISLLILSMPKAHNAQKQENTWFQSLCMGKEKVARVHFYVQDVLGGENPTVYEVARASITSNSATTFGQVRVVDDLLTAKPDYNSEKLGQVQGLITSADLEITGLAMNLNFVFTAGEYNGSTISILGRIQIGDASRELAVVGGTGIFRAARGYAITNTYSYDPVANYAVHEYMLYVTYVDGSDLVSRVGE